MNGRVRYRPNNVLLEFGWCYPNDVNRPTWVAFHKSDLMNGTIHKRYLTFVHFSESR